MKTKSFFGSRKVSHLSSFINPIEFQKFLDLKNGDKESFKIAIEVHCHVIFMEIEIQKPENIFFCLCLV